MFRIPLLLFIFILTSPLFAQDMSDDGELLFTDNEGITVVGTVQASQQMAVVEKDKIEKSSTPDVATLLQETLDVNITRYGAYGSMALVNLRGLDSKRIAFLIDGVPVNSSMDGSFNIEQIDPKSIDHIEVIYGGSDSKYNVSGAMGGVINIITIKKQNPGLQLGASVSNTSALPGKYRSRNGTTGGPNWEDLADTQNYTLQAAYGGKNISVSANAFANRAANHFLFTDHYGYTRRKDNNEVWDTGGKVSLVWQLPDLSKLIASSDIYYGDQNIPDSGFSRNFGMQQDITSRNNIMLDMPRIFRDDLAMEASVSWNYARRDYTSSADIFSRHDQQDVMAINRWSWYPGDKLTLRSGFDYRFLYLDSTDIGDRNRHDGGIYLTAEFKPVKSLMITPSVKAVFTSGGTTPVTAVPKLGFLWNINDSLTLKNNYFRSFKFPDFQDLYWGNSGSTQGNPNLRPEDGWGGDLGLSWRFKELFSLDSTFYTNWLKDSIHWYQGKGGVWRPENVGEAIFFGLENKLGFVIPVSLGQIKKINASLSYQYLLSYLLSFGYDFASDKRIPYSPVHTIGGSLELPWQTGSISINGQFESLRFSDRANISRLKPYFLLNATLNQGLGKRFTVFGTLKNILNQSYESFADYPMPGIALTLGLRMNLEKK